MNLNFFMIRTKIYNWSYEHRHPIFLIGLLLFFFLEELLDKIFSIHIPFPVLLSILIVSSILLIQTSPKKQILSYVLVVLFIAFLFLWNNYQESQNFGKAVFFLLFIYFSFITFYLYKYIIRSEKITSSLIIGAFTGYIMIGIIFFFVYIFLIKAYPDTLNIDIGNLEQGINDTFYFSFITLTTIGYGDFSPTSALGQKTAIMEGLLGQFYLAIVMATIVGKYLSKNSNA